MNSDNHTRHFGGAHNCVILIGSSNNINNLNIIHQYCIPDEEHRTDEYNLLKIRLEVTLAEIKTKKAELKESQAEFDQLKIKTTR